MSDAIRLTVVEDTPISLAVGEADPIARREIAELQEDVEAIQEDVADIEERLDDAVQPDGTYPALTSGAALSLTSPTAAESTWAQRVTDALDGVAVVDAVLGNTVVWNQMASYGAGASMASQTCTNASIDIDNHLVTATAGSSNVWLGRNNVPTVEGHKYLHKAEFMAEVAGATISFSPYYMSATRLNGTTTPMTLTESGKYYPYAAIVLVNTVTGTGGMALWRHMYSSNVDGKTIGMRNMQIFDLTRMFGAGNEPSTVAEFEALYPEPYYPYDAGSPLSVNLTGVESADADGNVLQQRSIPAATYFPQGMRSAGTVHDELTSDAAITRIGAVDLGTLTWAKYEGGTEPIFTTTPPDFFVSARDVTTIQCGKYDVLSAMTYQTFSAAGVDKAIATVTNIGAANRLGVHDTAYTDAAAFKAAMQGVMLYYALATPTTQAIDPPLNLTYRVSDFGTERVMHTDPTAAPTWRTRYPFDLAGTVMANIAPVEQPTATATHAIGDLLCVGWQLYRATRAIAIGEAITAGTNVTATTVAAELASIQ